MEKKLILLIIGIVVFLLSFSGIFLWYRSQQKGGAPITEIQPSVTPSVELATWVDPSEFSFQYPKNLTINPHEEDQKNYAHVELTSSEHKGNIIIWAKDTTADTIEKWLTQTKVKGVLDTTLGEEPAKKTLVLRNEGLQEDPSKVMVSSIRNGYLYQIEVNPENALFWNEVFDTVFSSWKWVVPTSGEKKEQSTKQAPVEQSEDTGSGDEEVIE